MVTRSPLRHCERSAAIHLHALTVTTPRQAKNGEHNKSTSKKVTKMSQNKLSHGSFCNLFVAFVKIVTVFLQKTTFSNLARKLHY